MGRELDSIEELIAAARELLSRGTAKVVVSMGGRGMLYVTAERTVYAPGLKVPVGSTVVVMFCRSHRSGSRPVA